MLGSCPSTSPLQPIQPNSDPDLLILVRVVAGIMCIHHYYPHMPCGHMVKNLPLSIQHHRLGVEKALRYDHDQPRLRPANIHSANADHIYSDPNNQVRHYIEDFLPTTCSVECHGLVQIRLCFRLDIEIWHKSRGHTSHDTDKSSHILRHTMHRPRQITSHTSLTYALKPGIGKCPQGSFYPLKDSQRFIQLSR